MKNKSDDFDIFTVDKFWVCACSAEQRAYRKRVESSIYAKLFAIFTGLPQTYFI